VVVIVGLFVGHAALFHFTQDDAYISLRFAQNLVDGHGLVFNPGERVEGYSNFTWTLLLALFLRLGAPPVETCTWLGVLFGASAIGVAARFARALEGRWGVATVATALLIAGCSAFALWSTGGLETALFTFLVTLGLERGLAPGVSRRGRRAAPIVLFLAALTRPDGPLIFALWYVVRVHDTLRRRGPAADGGRRELVLDALLYLLPMIPYALWKLAYYGDILPNTYYAKAGVSLAYVSRGARYALEYFHAYGAWGAVPLLALASLVRERHRGVEARLLFLWVGFAAYIVAIGGDVLYVHRFWLPILPIAALLVARGLTAVLEIAAARRRARPPFVPAGTIVLALALAGIGLAKNWESIQYRRQQEIGFVFNMKQTGLWLKDNLPPGARIAITTVGAIGYYSDLNVIDMLGLTDREIARESEMIEGLSDTWREIKYSAVSVLRRRPDAIMFSTGIRPSSAAEKALFLYETFFESYYEHYFRCLPRWPRIQSMYRLRPDAPPFRPDRLDVSDFEFLDLYGNAHLVQSRHAEFAAAAEDFRKSWELSEGKFPWAREWQAVALYDAGDSTALPLLREVAAEDPYAMVVLARLGDHALRSGDFDEAVRVFDAMLAINPDDQIGWFGRGEAALQKGDYETAFECYRESVLRWSGNATHFSRLGKLALHFGDLDLAEGCLAEALRLDPEHAGARRGVELLKDVRSGDRSRSPGGP
jgi:tetratricopeptide (TPR) repeat protein